MFRAVLITVALSACAPVENGVHYLAGEHRCRFILHFSPDTTEITAEQKSALRALAEDAIGGGRVFNTGLALDSNDGFALSRSRRRSFLLFMMQFEQRGLRTRTNNLPADVFTPDISISACS